MPEMDWLTSNEFKTLARERAKVAAYAERMTLGGNSPYLFDVYLNQYTEDNKRVELIKESSLRRTQADALQSVDSLVKEAAIIARNSGRDVISIADLQAAHAAKFCMVWPFCGKR